MCIAVMLQSKRQSPVPYKKSQVVCNTLVQIGIVTLEVVLWHASRHCTGSVAWEALVVATELKKRRSRATPKKRWGTMSKPAKSNKNSTQISCRTSHYTLKEKLRDMFYIIYTGKVH